MSDTNRADDTRQATEIHEAQLEQISAGNRGQDGIDLLIVNDGDGSDFARRRPIEAAGLEVVVAA